MFLGAKILCFKNIIFRIVLSGDTKGAAPRLRDKYRYINNNNS